MNMNIKKTVVAAFSLLALTSTHPSLAQDKFNLTSSDLQPNTAISSKFIFSGFGCEGQNVSPELTWTGAPAGTKSFALLVHDNKAPTGGAGWWHWVVYNIPATGRQLLQGAGTADGAMLPEGATQTNTDFGNKGWGEPCPPQGNGVHQYVFNLYALKIEKLVLPDTASASLAGFMINANSLGKAQLIAPYSR
jgi:Raf kinase inhibitor-like YbhB/YbcL family protein